MADELKSGTMPPLTPPVPDARAESTGASDATATDESTEGTDESARKRRPKPAADEVERLSIEDWRDRAGSVLGVSEHAVAGALSGDRRKTFTEEQVREALEAFNDPERTPGS